MGAMKYYKMALEDVLEVIDKHIDKYDKLIDDAILCKKIAIELDADTSVYEKDIRDFASAIASLILLYSELKGFVRY